MCNRFCKKKLGGGGFGGPPPRKFENCELMCNRLRMLRMLNKYSL